MLAPSSITSILIVQATYSNGWGRVAGQGHVSVAKEDDSTEAIKTDKSITAAGSQVVPQPGIEVCRAVEHVAGVVVVYVGRVWGVWGHVGGWRGGLGVCACVCGGEMD